MIFFFLNCDASGHAVGGCLLQEHTSKPVVIAYLSKALNESQKNWSTIDRECFAIFFCLQHMEKYLGTQLKILIRTGHLPLKTFITSGSKSPKGKRARY